MYTLCNVFKYSDKLHLLNSEWHKKEKVEDKYFLVKNISVFFLWQHPKHLQKLDI